MCLRIPRSWCAPCCCVALTVNALTKSTHTWTRQAQDVAPLASDHRVCKSSVGNLGIMVAGRYLVHNTLIYICTTYIDLVAAKLVLAHVPAAYLKFCPLLPETLGAGRHCTH